MDAYKKTLDSAYSHDELVDRRGATHSAINHWFVRNRGVQRSGFPVMYEPDSHANFSYPPCTDSACWDSLSIAEKRWVSTPEKNQNIEDKRQLWKQSHSNIQAIKSENNSTYAKMGQIYFDEDMIAAEKSNLLKFRQSNPKWREAGNW